MAPQSLAPAINQFLPCLAVMFLVGKARAPWARRGPLLQPEKLFCLWTGESNVTTQLASRYPCSLEQAIPYHGIHRSLSPPPGPYLPARNSIREVVPNCTSNKGTAAENASPLHSLSLLAHGYMFRSRKMKNETKRWGPAHCPSLGGCELSCVSRFPRYPGPPAN